MALHEAKPDPKEQPVRAKRYRRKVASPKQWQAIVEAKGDTCVMCEGLIVAKLPVQYHHLVPRSMGGDDVADNIVPLCEPHHRSVTERQPNALLSLVVSLSGAEYAYIVGKLGGIERLMGVRDTR